nr:uncharacterized protein LOC109157302 isoform X1 [Ipomoea batatas]
MSRDELQKEPNLFECFEQMQKKKDGMFVDERSKRIAEEIQARHDAATQEAEGSTESPNIDMSQFCGSSATSQLHQDAMKEMMNQQLETMRAEMDVKLQAERVLDNIEQGLILHQDVLEMNVSIDSINHHR